MTSPGSPPLESGSPSSAEPPREGALTALWRRRGPALRIWARFAVAIAALMLLTLWARPFLDGPLVEWIAWTCAATLQLAGLEASAEGATVRSAIGSMEVIRECTAAYPTALFAAAVLAHPAPWRRRMLGIVLGVVALQVVNVARLLSLLWIGSRYPRHFEMAHLVVWQSLIVLFAVVFWIVWVNEMAGDRRR